MQIAMVVKPLRLFTLGLLLGGCAAMTEGPYRVERGDPILVEVPDETARTGEEVTVELVDVLPGGAIRLALNHHFTAPVMRAEEIEETRHFEEYIDRNGNVVGRRLRVGRVHFDCAGCGQAVKTRRRSEKSQTYDNHTPTGEIREWKRALFPAKILVLRNGTQERLARTGPGGDLTLTARPLVVADAAPPSAPEIVIMVQSEVAPTSLILLDDVLSAEQWFEMWGGLRMGEVEDRSLFNTQLQRRLTLLGFDTHGVDGILGEQSRAAARLYVRLCEPSGVAEREITPTLLAHMSSRLACGYFDAYAAQGIHDADNRSLATRLLVYHTGGSYLSTGGDWRPIERSNPISIDTGDGKSEQQAAWERRISSSIEINPDDWQDDDSRE